MEHCETRKKSAPKKPELVLRAAEKFGKPKSFFQKFKKDALCTFLKEGTFPTSIKFPTKEYNTKESKENKPKEYQEKKLYWKTLKKTTVKNLTLKIHEAIKANDYDALKKLYGNRDFWLLDLEEIKHVTEELRRMRVQKEKHLLHAMTQTLSAEKKLKYGFDRPQFIRDLNRVVKLNDTKTLRKLMKKPAFQELSSHQRNEFRKILVSKK